MKHVYVALVGGLPGVVLDYGMYKLDKKIEALEIPNHRFTVETGAWFGWKSLRNEAISLYRKKDLDYLILIGMSWGCLKNIQFAQDVGKHGIYVRYLAAFDPTALFPGMPEMAVPANVEFVDELWAKWGAPAHARRGDPEGGRGGMYVYPHNTPREAPHKFNLGHVPIASNDDAQKIVLDRIVEMFT